MGQKGNSDLLKWKRLKRAAEGKTCNVLKGGDAVGMKMVILDREGAPSL